MAMWPAPASAKPGEIADPAGDHPVPFMDLTGVRLALVQQRGASALEVTFALNGAITPESRVAMTGYTFLSEVGTCDLMVRFVAYPDGAFEASGFVTTKCGASGRDVAGTYKIKENTIVVTAAIRDLKGVVPGQKMTALRAYTSPVEGMYHDDTTAPAAVGDAASSSEPWTIA